jgi:hypothetical protein
VVGDWLLLLRLAKEQRPSYDLRPVLELGVSPGTQNEIARWARSPFGSPAQPEHEAKPVAIRGPRVEPIEFVHSLAERVLSQPASHCLKAFGRPADQDDAYVTAVGIRKPISGWPRIMIALPPWYLPTIGRNR